MSDLSNEPAFLPPASVFTGPVAELIAQRMLVPPSRPGLLAGVDHFEILRVLGGGGMGIVLLARDTKTGREVAVKMVKTDLVNNLNVVHRFFREAGHLKRLQHTNIVPVLEISEKVEIPYFVMPYFEKGSLASRLKPGFPLETGMILTIASQLAEGLSFAHRSGIIHRDLKPANILLGASDHVCLADFGLARTLFNDTIADVGSRQLEGTAPYMSPAVAAGDVEDTRCDIYSFGALLYEMLTGHPPYKGRGTKEILDQIIAGPPKPIDNLNPRADRGLIAVAEKAMARELRDRYADMRDILKDLQQIKEGKPPVGQRMPLHRMWQSVLIPACIVGLFFLGWFFWHRKPAPAPVPAPVATTPVVTPAAPTPTAPARPPANPPASVLTMATVAGQAGVSGHADGAGVQAQFSLPNNLVLDPAGDLYVADTANNTIRKITPDGTVSTAAGVAGSHGNTDGAGSQARFWAPFGIAIDGSGNLYIADTANNIIRKMTPDGTVTTVAGTPGFPGNRDGLGAAARFRNPWSVAADSSGNVYVADMSNNSIRKITPTGLVSTVAGLGGLSGNTDGVAAAARFNHPFALAVDGADNIYVSDTANNAIRKITPNGAVTTIAGLPGYAGNADGTGDSARFSAPQGLATDAAGNVYVADTGNNAIRKITPTGTVTTLPIPALVSNAKATNATNAASLNNPDGVAVDSTGNIYVADTGNHCIRKLTFSPAASR
jgi:sugar lactone lactonase YvrE